MTLTELKEKIKELTVEEVVAHYLPVKKEGRYSMVLCPFHHDKNPSMHLRSQAYHCFGCGAKGDAIQFVKDYRKLDFKDAILETVSYTHLTLPTKRIV